MLNSHSAIVMLQNYNFDNGDGESSGENGLPLQSDVSDFEDAEDDDQHVPSDSFEIILSHRLALDPRRGRSLVFIW